MKRTLKNNDNDADLIDDVVNIINALQRDIDSTCLEIRAIKSPESEIQRMNDTCLAFTTIANKKAEQFRLGNPAEDISWPDARSVFDISVSSICSSQTSKSETSSKPSKHSSILSLSAKQAAAEVAATTEVIKIMNAQHQQEEEVKRLKVGSVLKG